MCCCALLKPGFLRFGCRQLFSRRTDVAPSTMVEAREEGAPRERRSAAVAVVEAAILLLCAAYESSSADAVRGHDRRDAPPAQGVGAPARGQ
jgi:hypothetical protein